VPALLVGQRVEDRLDLGEAASGERFAVRL
jgi:hypothetical protein